MVSYCRLTPLTGVDLPKTDSSRDLVVVDAAEKSSTGSWIRNERWVLEASGPKPHPPEEPLRSTDVAASPSITPLGASRRGTPHQCCFPAPRQGVEKELCFCVLSIFSSGKGYRFSDDGRFFPALVDGERRANLVGCEVYRSGCPFLALCRGVK
ncbi:hypothetical protein H6P81_008785 [Aristolochia fimbriata]|uniref:Uncharacterized protein n=1 Tax=Aristolochia fimbriata TaxID=158543 RepID=A0AAV7EJ04_ARIFI|nr:hypothetical protein H6P81_008785 [Aristolochia fimbriata]